MHLGVQVGAQDRRLERQDGSVRCGEGEDDAPGSIGASCVPYRRRGQFGGNGHVGAVVLDGLEGGDRAAELDAHFGVFGGHVGAGASDAGGLGGNDQSGEIGQRRAGTDQDIAGCTVERDAAGLAGEVEVGRHGDGDARSVGGDDGHIGADADHDEVGQPGRQGGAGIAGECAGCGLHIAAECDAGLHRAVGQTGQQACLLLIGATRVDDRAGDDRGDERAGGQAAAEFLGDHDGFLEAVAGTAVLLGQVQPQPAEFGGFTVERRAGLRSSVQQGTGEAERLALGQQVGDGVGKGAVVIGDRNGHRCKP
ncbi:unannotated protein [freshwater metagenome]|uniref:Unannotated protein n=1 Tax=freshwater metagenome TaxID=449393 RepID=A0A6J7QQZ3_9ZZZZ